MPNAPAAEARFWAAVDDLDTAQQGYLTLPDLERRMPKPRGRRGRR